MAHPLPITLHELGPETASGSSAPIDIGADRTCCRLLLDVTEDTAGQFSLVVETSYGGMNPDWKPVATSTPASEPHAQVLFGFWCARYLRCSWTLPGGGQNPPKQATFQLSGETYQTYVNLHDIEQSMPAAMFAAMPPEVLAHAALDATDEAESYLAARYGLPLTSWSHALRLFVGKMAFYHAMCRRGYNPDNIDEMIRKGYEDALAWLRGEGGAGAVGGIVDSTPDESESGAYMVSAPPRGWYPW